MNDSINLDLAQTKQSQNPSKHPDPLLNTSFVQSKSIQKANFSMKLLDKISEDNMIHLKNSEKLLVKI